MKRINKNKTDIRIFQISDSEYCIAAQHLNSNSYISCVQPDSYKSLIYKTYKAAEYRLEHSNTFYKGALNGKNTIIFQI